MVTSRWAVFYLFLSSPFTLKTSPAISNLPVAFERNEGQAPAAVQFVARTQRHSVWLSANEVGIQSSTAGAFQMRFVNPKRRVRLEALDPLPGKSNYLSGRDPRAWHTGIPNFATVCYRGVYLGIDVLFHASASGSLEYDFRVAPGADPALIRLAFIGVRAMKIDIEGNLILVTAKGEWLQRKPRIFQEQSAVEGRYELLGSRQAGFALGHYDRTQPLVIDPVISYATYFGGQDTTINAIAVDGEGMVYLTGATDTGNLPVTPGAYDTRFHGGSDAFVAKLNASGTALVYSTFIGGTADDTGTAIGVDAAGNVYVMGSTSSADFPVTPTALRVTGDIFLAKLDPTGSKLLYSALLPSGGFGSSNAMAVSPSGELFVAGSTGSSDFPLLNSLQQPNGAICSSLSQRFPCPHAFLMRWRSSDMTLLYSTLLGGSMGDTAGAIALDAENNIYLTGGTNSPDFPLVNAIQSAPGGGTSCYMDINNVCADAFVAKISADGKTLIYSTLLGGQGDDYGRGIAVDSAGNAYVVGSTGSKNFPLVHAFQSTLEGDAQGFSTFIAKIDPQGQALVFSTYYNQADANGVLVDASGNAYVALTTSNNGLSMQSTFTTAELNPCAGGATHIQTPLLAEFRPDGSLAYADLVGGTYLHWFNAMVLDKSGYLYLAGSTSSGDFPTTTGSLQPGLDGGIDSFNGFIAKIDPSSSPAPQFALAAACVVNAANYINLAGGTGQGSSGFVAPGEIITIFGSGLGPDTAAGAVLDSQGRIATALAGVSLTFDGIAAPLLYVQANQVNAIVPFEVAGKQYTTIELQYNGAAAQPAKMQVADSVPGIFTIGGEVGQIAAFNQDGTLNSPANPAERGSIVAMWATGMGLLSQSYANGQIVTGSFGKIVNPPQFIVNGLAAEIRYIGQAPDLVAGAIQINLVVPAGLPPGPNVVHPGGGTISVK